MVQSIFAALVAFIALGLGAAPALAENKKFDRAETAAKLRSLFPHGHRDGREGVMKIGGNFRSVARRTWEQCRDLCLQSPSDGALGCAVWTFVKADDPKSVDEEALKPRLLARVNQVLPAGTVAELKFEPIVVAPVQQR